MTMVEHVIAQSDGVRLIRIISTIGGEDFTIMRVDDPETAITLTRYQAMSLVVGLKRLIDDTGELAMLAHEQDTSDPDVRNAIDAICERLGVTIDWEDENG